MGGDEVVRARSVEPRGRSRRHQLRPGSIDRLPRDLRHSIDELPSSRRRRLRRGRDPRRRRRLRVKESDRLAALASSSGASACAVEEAAGRARRSQPSAALHGGARRAARRSSHRDGFAVAGLAGRGVRIDDPECVEMSFPGFFARLASLRAPA